MTGLPSSTTLHELRLSCSLLAAVSGAGAWMTHLHLFPPTRVPPEPPPTLQVSPTPSPPPFSQPSREAIANMNTAPPRSSSSTSSLQPPLNLTPPTRLLLPVRISAKPLETLQNFPLQKSPKISSSPIPPEPPDPLPPPMLHNQVTISSKSIFTMSRTLLPLTKPYHSPATPTVSDRSFIVAGKSTSRQGAATSSRNPRWHLLKMGLDSLGLSPKRNPMGFHLPFTPLNHPPVYSPLDLGPNCNKSPPTIINPSTTLNSRYILLTSSLPSSPTPASFKSWCLPVAHQSPISQGHASHSFVLSALVAEELTLKTAIAAVKSLGDHSLNVFLDTQSLLNLFSTGNVVNELKNLLLDINDLCSSFSHISYIISLVLVMVKLILQNQL